MNTNAKPESMLLKIHLETEYEIFLGLFLLSIGNIVLFGLNKCFSNTSSIDPLQSHSANWCGKTSHTQDQYIWHLIILSNMVLFLFHLTNVRHSNKLKYLSGIKPSTKHFAFDYSNRKLSTTSSKWWFYSLAMIISADFH